MSQQMKVTRNQDGSHSPAYDEDWPEVTRLEWHAAVIALETGLRIDVECTRNLPAGVRVRDYPDARQDIFRISVKGTWAMGITDPVEFKDAWNFLDGVKVGTVVNGGGVLPQR
jgi:hypothetical protein